MKITTEATHCQLNPLELEVLDIINKTVGGRYVGQLKVVKEDDWYILLLHLNQEQAPMRLGIEGTEEDFKKYIEDEIRTRRLHWTSYWQAFQEVPYIKECGHLSNCECECADLVDQLPIII